MTGDLFTSAAQNCGMTTPTWTRRRLLGSLALAGWLPACASTAGGIPRYRISMGQLEGALARRFPLRHSLQGLLRLELPAPRLRTLPHENRLSAEFTLTAGGPALRRELQGLFDLDFALRYEPQDRTIRARQPRVNLFQIAGLPRDAADSLLAYGPALAEHALHDLVLHQLRPEDLALADTMGLQPGAIHVESAGLVVEFVPKPPART